ncbi:hypothetical protein HXX76_014078 [Chlamydomonas incerta]|uniref:mRNA capping enzyme adenylation domain-containing protein n=1 Tax=Chlamydomonas incerta TaxID=51695 RepID=A0A835SQF7_CHLIN|nr:hypothetical protein HXX76_014072 [Chlamydomonas incerta]KAG2424920.1 hypothetical protein HXX76_014078 [Chlamydomonas incerta]|eukprot:KAG2424914.1 hypothetical protein HXX76_014072 [Chlamydomonas incerta]
MALLTKEISFCGGVAQNIVDAEFKEELAQLIAGYGFGVLEKRSDRFEDPRAQDLLRRVPHLVCLRAHGNPYFMLLTRYQDKNVCIFVDKKVQTGYTQPRMITAPFCFASDLFTGTLLDGEMVRDDNGDWVFLLNDLCAYQGESAYDWKLFQRLDAISDVLEKKYRPILVQPCAVQVKRYCKVTQVAGLLDGLAQQLPYRARGITFKPIYWRFKETYMELPGPGDPGATKGGGDGSGTAPQEEGQTKKQPPATPQKLANRAAQGPPAVTVVVHAGVSRDNYPDGYRVHARGGGAPPVGALYVRSLAESLRLYDAFKALPPAKQLVFQVKLNAAFGKYQIVWPAAAPAAAS